MSEQIDIIGIHDNQDLAAPIEYTLDLILSTYGVKYKIMPLNEFEPGEYSLSETLFISYGRGYSDIGAKKHIHIYASNFFGNDYLEPASLPKIPLRRYNHLPIIYRGYGDFEGWFRKSTGLIETNIDIIASAFFMLSRYEEVISPVKDEHGRFPAKASLAYRDGFLDRPIVNEYIELLWSCIETLRPEMTRKPFWPDNRDFAVCLTHDVDFLKKYSLLPPVISIGSAALRQRNLRLSFCIASDYLGALFHVRKDPFDTFDYILNLEHKHGFKSSFYFMAGGISGFDNRYSLTDPKLMRLLKQVEDSGCEIGAHISYNSYNHLEHMLSEKDKLGTVVRGKNYGCRQHYLRWKTPDSWRFQEKASFLYDTTMSFADHIGFRCGICLPYQPFDVVENRKLNIWELPLIAQDGTLQNANYQNLSPDKAYENIIKHIDTVSKLGGVFVLSWHNSSFDPLGGWSGWRKVYEDVMTYIGKQNVFVDTGKNIIKWWQAISALR